MKDRCCGNCLYSRRVQEGLPIVTCHYLRQAVLPVWIGREISREVLTTPMMSRDNDGRDCGCWKEIPGIGA